ncbi:hypothetical protein F4775DRAFT_589574 [Biscogniauxia sp. FL1348]|nr:hypothetical protein F4775DRAFT_589574 [Biscogniauxia sp. FL1348]
MASRNLQERRYMAPPPDAGDFTETDAGSLANDSRHKRRKRDANVYDAVAGRVTTTLPLDNRSSPEPTHHRRPARDRRRDPTLAPEDVLFQRRRAPVRFAEKDIYFAHEDLEDGGRGPGGVLPDSDMLKAIHSYTSEFYAALAARTDSGGEPGRGTSRTQTAGNIDERSMDETALLALGILLEEAGREVLGKRGDLVFTEGLEVTASPAAPAREGDGESITPSSHHGYDDEDHHRDNSDDAEIVGFRDVITNRGSNSWHPY